MQSSTKTRSPFARLGRHVRDWFISAFPLEMQTDGGLKVRLRNRSELSVYHSIFVERVYPLREFAGELASVEAPVVFDVGANSGLFAAAALGRWSGSSVHSFEPNANLIPRIHEVSDMNGCTARHHVNRCAVSDRNGEAAFYENRNPISASLLREKAERRTLRRVSRVPLLRLDDYAARHAISAVHVLKLDVEGVELDALRGAEQILATVRLLFLEVHPPFSTFGQVRVLLDRAGLHCVAPIPLPSEQAQANCIFIRQPNVGS